MNRLILIDELDGKKQVRIQERTQHNNKPGVAYNSLILKVHSGCGLVRRPQQKLDSEKKVKISPST
jgi:hypothetical protein